MPPALHLAAITTTESATAVAGAGIALAQCCGAPDVVAVSCRG